MKIIGFDNIWHGILDQALLLTMKKTSLAQVITTTMSIRSADYRNKLIHGTVFRTVSRSPGLYH
ncbi:MAG: hypothetical protein LC660_07560, partial [Desulfobacteraceae bacterium]|nr:hypothetical protein [Desulfobacteraceae bacterium]